MKITYFNGYSRKRKNGSSPQFSITINPETEEERMLLMMMRSSVTREVHVSEEGKSAHVEFSMPRGKY